MDGGSFTSDEVNFLVYRYLLENGFQHTAFTFGCESNIANSSIDGTMVPRGALIAIIQKGLHFTEAEFFAAIASTSADTNDTRLFESNLGTMGLLEAVLPDTERMKLLEKKVIEELGEEACSRIPPNLRIVEPQQPVSDISASSSRSSSDVESLDGMEDENEDANADQQPGPSNSSTLLLDAKNPPPAPPTSQLSNNAATSSSLSNSTAAFPPAHSIGNEPNGMPSSLAGGSSQASEYPAFQGPPPSKYTNGSNPTVGKIKAATTAAAHKQPGLNGTNPRGDAGGPPLSVAKNGKLLPNTPGIDPELEIDWQNVITLEGHVAEFHCMSSWCPALDVDIVATGLQVGRRNGAHLAGTQTDDRTMHAHVSCSVLDHRNETTQSDVTGVDWDVTGTYLATACYDGAARIWNREGVKVNEMAELHSGPIFALKWSPSGTRILSAGVDNSTAVWDPKTMEKMKFAFHRSSALDVDWIDDEVFASCSVDCSIHVCRIGVNQPIKTYRAHENEVNAVRYNRLSGLLASCSDDRSLKIWALDKDGPVFNVLAHNKEIHAVRWAPGKQNIVATASFDHTHKIYDNPSIRLPFSPDSRLLASGSFDGSVIVHDLSSGKRVFQYTGTNGVFEVDWNRRGDRLAAASDDGCVRLFDVRSLKQA
ncbi:F-box-like/WD repeat-containing protein ebi [Aphelenchoides fujianensis]|nr:F-box-like/WD repeat-containing protein ebi [Aphelenchoides fujianensis]